MQEGYEITSRYEALGIPLPNPKTMCKGDCEGTGVFPVKDDDLSDTRIARLWADAHSKAHTLLSAFRELWTHLEYWYWKSIIRDLISGKWFHCDGWHFVKCPDCDGTGKRK